jgi:hypothetical protein
MTEFDDVIRLLREHRPEATPLELDQIKQRARAKAARPSRRSQPMKSRLAILSMLVVGVLMSMTGVGFAITGLSSSTNDASVAEYSVPTPGGGVSPGQETHPGSNNNQPNGGVKPAQQVAAGATTNQLPFTGFAAIPVLIAGLGLLSVGLVMRRRARSDS